MSKLLVETTSDIMLMDVNTGIEIPFNRPAVCVWSTFLDARLALGQVRIVSKPLTEEATDALFVECLAACDGKMELAVEAFEAEFLLDTGELGDKKPVETVEKKADQPPKTQPVKGA